jgi:hypothetical protein
MSKPLKTPSASQPPSSAERRTAKLEAALRTNLKKRKDGQRTDKSPQTPGPDTGPDTP